MQLHPQEALLQQARALQQSEAFGGYRQHRVVVEHRLARLVQLGIRQPRYFGRIKTRFQLYLAATVADLTLVAAKAGLPAGPGCGSSAGSAFHAGTIRSALEIVPARLAQILTLALLASASLPKYISEQGFPARFLGSKCSTAFCNTSFPSPRPPRSWESVNATPSVSSPLTARTAPPHCPAVTGDEGPTTPSPRRPPLPW